ncbi:hypothetical protein Leryth_025550 [Lithospermum erythrorhizon]|nr:hypothetical protein Leryth_025550 [Lithospermum erythrorhizon]
MLVKCADVLYARSAGLGCSSIAYGIEEELGPFHVEKDGKTFTSTLLLKQRYP